MGFMKIQKVAIELALWASSFVGFKQPQISNIIEQSNLNLSIQPIANHNNKAGLFDVNLLENDKLPSTNITEWLSAENSLKLRFMNKAEYNALSIVNPDKQEKKKKSIPVPKGYGENEYGWKR